LVAGIFSGAGCLLGLTLAAIALEGLFGRKIPRHFYIHLTVSFGLVVAPWIVLGAYPKDTALLDVGDDMPRALRFFAQWAMRPLLERHEFAWVRRFLRVFYAGLVVFAVLLALALFRRLFEYGWTEVRVLLGLVTVVFFGLAMAFTLRPNLSRLWVPASLGARVGDPVRPLFAGAYRNARPDAAARGALAASPRRCPLGPDAAIRSRGACEFVAPARLLLTIATCSLRFSIAFRR
jgi:hypothetical protein